MLHLGARARLVLALGAASTLAACASIFGIDEPDIVDSGAGGGDASTDGPSTDGTVVGEGATDAGTSDAASGDATNGDAADADVDADADADAANMDSAVIVPDASVCGEVPDPSVGVFVAPNGMDITGCGDALTPCLRIQTGITLAFSRNKPNVYVASGTYAEALSLDAGITVWGGWNVETVDGGDAWSGVCTNPIGAVIIQPTTGNVTVTASSLGASAAGLKTLTIESKPQANVAPGESLYGVFATGSTTLTLENVDITLGNGGDGAPGYIADGGIEGNPVCNPGDGGPGVPGGPDGGGADAGSFTAAGYQPIAGDFGGGGVGGSSGRADDAGTCVGCVSCTAVAIVGCQSTATTTSCGGPGGSGCGGGAGNGGGAGGGGGSSVAIFASGATVTVIGGMMTPGNGGQGGAGGSGGPGGAGGTGVTGQNGNSCTVNCNIVGVELTCPSATSGAGQGSLGTTGGNGSNGGAGGGGAGGWSCAIALGGAGNVSAPSPAMLNHGNYGAGVGGGQPGKAKQVCP